MEQSPPNNKASDGTALIASNPFETPASAANIEDDLRNQLRELDPTQLATVAQFLTHNYALGTDTPDEEFTFGIAGQSATPVASLSSLEDEEMAIFQDYGLSESDLQRLSEIVLPAYNP